MLIEGLLQLKNYSRLWGYSSEKNKDFAWIDYIIRIQIVNKSSAPHNMSARGKKKLLKIIVEGRVGGQG